MGLCLEDLGADDHLLKDGGDKWDLLLFKRRLVIEKGNYALFNRGRG